MEQFLRQLSNAEREKLQNLPLEEKVKQSITVIKAAYDDFGREKIAVAWTGGKDSTLLLWLVRRAAEELGEPLPKCQFIDEGDVFPEIWDFVNEWKEKWGVDLHIYHNEDVSRQVNGKIGAPVRVADLNERNRREVARLGYEEETFPYEPESYVGNHLMKTVMITKFIEDHQVQGYLAGIRWDEQEARAEETFFSPREETPYNPSHIRIFPILHFREKDVWDAIHQYQIPYVKLYEKGYRSLGARVTTRKADEKPAWEQDLEHIPERAGRQQDKEGIMKRLRDLGYM